MKKSIVFSLNTLGWLMVFIALIMGAVFAVGSNYKLYFDLQMKEDILAYAGVGSDDLLLLDRRLSDYLFTPMNADTAFDNREIEVHGEMQPPFNEKELIHLHDCRKLLSIAAKPFNYCILAGAGVALVLCGKRRKAAAAWVASAIIVLPLGIFALWAAIDFHPAFSFFHRVLFTNDLWLLNPQTDLLIRICPASMFAGIGLRIGLYSAGFLLGLPLLLTILNRISEKRKKDTNEIPQI